MSKEIDEKVVSMKFDNKDFMDKTEQTMTRLDKLKASLRLNDAAKGFEDVGKAANNVNLNQVGDAAEQVRVKFDALQVFATTVLANIANAAYNAGKRIVTALTIDPIKMGLQEYETQINAVQTILANTESKGTTLDDVNSALDELNAYADKTIYNFTEMTRNIGTFTAAGVDLDTSVNAIQGIANLAAVSGSTSQQASTAMYQLSQALSSGTVKLMDWNSVVNAGMGGQVFQDALKETARVHDIAIDDMIEEEGSFRETLSEGWLTSEILTETLSKFTMATEGLTEAQIEANREKLKSLGYDEEQIEGIFKLGNTATNAATKVKTFTQLMDTLKEAAQSGWTQTWEILIGDFEEAKELWTSVSDVFNKIIGDSAEARNTMLQGWADGGGRQALLDSFVNVWKALVAIVKPIKEAFREIFPPTTSAQLIKITEAIRDFTSKLILSEHAQEKLKSTFKGLFAVLDIGVHIIKEIGKGAWKVFSALVGVVVDLAGGVNDATGSFGDWLVGLRDTIKSSTLLTTIVNGVVTVLLKIVEGIKLVVNHLKESKILTNIISGIAYVFNKLGTVIKTVYSYLQEHVKFKGLEMFLTIITAIWTGIKYVFGKIKEAIGDAGSAFMDAFRAGDFKAALDIFNGGIVAGILLGIKNFTDGFGEFKSGVKSITDSVTGILDSVRDCFKAYQQQIKANTLMTIAKAIALLTAAIVVLSFINPEKLKVALGAIALMFVGLTSGITTMAKVSGDLKSFRLSTTLVGMSIAVLILASALTKLAKLDTNEIGKSFLVLMGLAAIVTMFTKTLGKSLNAQKKTAIIKYSSALLAFALGLRVLTSACKELGQMNTVELIKGLVAVGVLMAGISAFIKMTSMNKQMASTMKGILGMSIAIGILALSFSTFAKLSWEGLAKGLVAVVTLIFAIAAAMRLMPEQMLFRVALSLQALCGVLVLLTATMIIFGHMSMEMIGKGLLALGGALFFLSAALMIMEDTLKGAAALIIAAVALNMIAIPLKILGSMSLASVGIALLALAGTLVIFGVAGLLLQPIVPILSAFALAVLAMGGGLLAACVGMYAFTAALILLGTAGPVAMLGIVTALGVLLAGIAGLAGPILAALISIIGVVCDAIIAAAPKIFKALGVLLDGICNLVIEYVPKILAVLAVFIAAILKFLYDHAEEFAEAAANIVINLMKGLAHREKDLIAAAFDLIVKLFEGLAAAIDEYLPQLWDAAVDIGESICEGIGYGIGAGGGSIWTMIKSTGKGILDGFKKTLGINSPAKVMIPIGQGIDEGTVVGIERYQGLITDATDNVGKSAVESMSNAISGISDVIDADIDSQPTIRPVLDLSDVESGAGAINNMFGMTPSVDVLSNVGSINSMMRNNQNGENFDIISAIKDLGAKIGEMSGNSYVINGITYDDGSNVANAVESIIRAAKIERRI